MRTLIFVSLVTVVPFFLLGPPAAAQLPLPGLPVAVGGPHATFAPGDVFVSLETGQGQWRNPHGTLHGGLGGGAHGVTPDGTTCAAAGNTYCAHNLSAGAK